MTNATPALLALLLVLSLPATSLVAADLGGETHSEPSASFQLGMNDHPTPIEVEETTNRLELTGPVQNEYEESAADFGATLAGADNELRIDHEQYVLVDREFENASDEERAEILDSAHAQLADHIETLREREEDAVREHAAGERSGDELRQTLIRNYQESATLLNALDRLEERANEVPGYSLSSNQVSEDTRALEIHQSPVQSELAVTSQELDDDDRFQFLIQTSEDGYRLSTIDGSVYLSETTRFDNRDPDASDQFTDQSALDYAGELYPWADEHGSDNYIEAGSIHDVWFTHDDFEIRMYLDGGASEVNREIQELSIGSLPVENQDTDAEDGLEIERRETPANGPVELTVTDADSGSPVSATVAIGDHVLGETDDDGSLWYVPPDSSYELTIAPTGEGGSSTIDVRNT